MMTDRELNWLVWKNVFGLDEMDCAATGLPDVPHYSTDIARAWEVIEKMREKGFMSEVGTRYQDATTVSEEYYCKVFPVDTPDENLDYLPFVKAISAPRAICLAALKAVGCKAER